MKKQIMMKRRSFFIALVGFGLTVAQTTVAATWYVSLDGTGQGTEGWADATNNLQGAIDACIKGDTVWVSNGVYDTGARIGTAGESLSNRVVITKAITVRSLSDDPTKTVIKGRWDPEGNGPSAIRCVYIKLPVGESASLIGFTVTNGATRAVGGSTPTSIPDNKGGGITYETSTKSVVSNCIVTGNSASYMGGGVNVPYNSKFSVYNSVIVNNKCPASRGSGMYGGVLYNCVITQNKGALVINNSKLYNCLLIRNTADVTFSGSTAIYNCTIANNNRGIYSGKAYNCIIYNNKLHNHQPHSVLSNCCTTPAQENWVEEDGNITTAPLFVNSDADDYRLKRDSPCINAGDNSAWAITGVDLGGNFRIDKVSGLVDMGCYEYQLPLSGTILTIK